MGQAGQVGRVGRAGWAFFSKEISKVPHMNHPVRFLLSFKMTQLANCILPSLTQEGEMETRSVPYPIRTIYTNPYSPGGRPCSLSGQPHPMLCYAGAIVSDCVFYVCCRCCCKKSGVGWTTGLFSSNSYIDVEMDSWEESYQATLTGVNTMCSVHGLQP